MTDRAEVTPVPPRPSRERGLLARLLADAGFNARRASPLQHWADCSYWRKEVVDPTCDCPIGKIADVLAAQATGPEQEPHIYQPKTGDACECPQCKVIRAVVPPEPQAQTHRNIIGESFTDGDLVAAGQDWGDAVPTPRIQVDEALVRLGLTPTSQLRDTMRGLLGLSLTGEPQAQTEHPSAEGIAEAFVQTMLAAVEYGVGYAHVKAALACDIKRLIALKSAPLPVSISAEGLAIWELVKAWQLALLEVRQEKGEHISESAATQLINAEAVLKDAICRVSPAALSASPPQRQEPPLSAAPAQGTEQQDVKCACGHLQSEHAQYRHSCFVRHCSCEQFETHPI